MIDIKHLNGLTDNEAAESRLKHGVNILTPPEKQSLWSQFVDKFNDPLIKILLVALVLSIGISTYEAFGLGEPLTVYLEPVGIFIAVTLATLVGFLVEVNANKKFEMLNQVNDEVAVKVVRNGNITQIPRKDVVVGDIVMLETGEEVPADGILLDSISLSINESALTGEPVIKKSHRKEDFDKDATYPTDHALRGTTVTEGHGIMQVTAVGDATEYGKVYEEAQIDNNVKTPLSLQFDRLGRFISIGSYIVGAIIIIGRLAIFDYAAHSLSSVQFINYFMVTIMLAVTLIVVSVPEGLPMSVTLSLALSMRRMFASNNLVRKMHACETMGATSVICTDKTGTLTQNQMRIYEARFFGLKNGNTIADDDESRLISEAISCNSSAFLDRSNADRPTALGNPTEGALLLWLNDNGIDYLNIRESCPVVAQLPFSTERKFMATIVRSNTLNRNVLYIKGAPEIIYALCNSTTGNVAKADIDNALASYQSKAMRTLGFARQVLEDGESPICDGTLKADRLQFTGIVAISDPVREDVPDAISECLEAGIQVKIVTGDTPGTACEIGRQVGLWTDADTDENRISGHEFAALSDNEARRRAKKIKIMSRARPSDKSRLVNLLQQSGEVVAVTGDGTNDAPALNAAQVGLSMGDGTSVAKEASDITIMDNSFTSITKAVMWGRSLYQNIQRFILFQLTVNVVACLIVGIGAFMSYQSPLTVTQMLWVNLIMDTFAALALASLPPSTEVMNHKPRKQSDFIINRNMVWFILGIGIIFILFLFGLMQYLKQHQIESLTEFSFAGYARSFFDFHYNISDEISLYDHTIFFTIFVFLQFWNLFNAKSFQSGHSAFWKIKESKVFFGTLLMIFVGQILIVEFGGQMFSVYLGGLKFIDWVYIISGTSVVLWIGEIVHLFDKRRKKRKGITI